MPFCLGHVSIQWRIMKFWNLNVQSTYSWSCFFSVLCDVSHAAEDQYRPEVMCVTWLSVVVALHGTKSYWQQTEQHAMQWVMQAAYVCDCASRSSVPAGPSVYRFLNFTFPRGWQSTLHLHVHLITNSKLVQCVDDFGFRVHIVWFMMKAKSSDVTLSACPSPIGIFVLIARCGIWGYYVLGKSIM